MKTQKIFNSRTTADIQYIIKFGVKSIITHLAADYNSITNQLPSETTYSEVSTLHIDDINDYILCKTLEKQWGATLINFNKSALCAEFHKSKTTRTKNTEKYAVQYINKFGETVVETKTRFYYTDTTLVDETIYMKIVYRFNPNKKEPEVYDVR